MKTLLKTITSGEDKIYVYEAGYVEGVKAAEAYLAGPDGWGASMYFPLYKVEDFAQNQTQIAKFLELAKEKLGMEKEPCNTCLTHN
ncbi:hypothetical protein OA7_0010475 [Vibrio cyclitrophicus 1F53]|uniref:hypothetical protein n=1 Tax=Vibrio cyclitrophicus TaxID=47951 RepID=UPI000305B200|nr:hypothetical protein [Vibrio cyclitrophicus]OEF34702.1 hypothetical protein OA7_10140 [Vibrio cyclitrophicus 1F53]OEF67272.1 hypothetical protein OAA_06210 [Vibrio cyclitrophicus 1F175]PMH24619.1 hypothetical protein BCU72_06865 [Vibrio cyclitrophicus]PMH93325.1 hypothetical protein BCU60_03820 [Vibrio cyclitrophicus]